MTNSSNPALFEGGNELPRILLFTGKGGVGKTTLAAAHGLASAAQQKPTALLSLDRAHNLGDLFEVGPCPQPTAINDHLDLIEIDPASVQAGYPDLTAGFARMLAATGDRPSRLDLQSLGGLDNLFFLLGVLEVAESGRYQRIIVDCAPTGETIALLELPDQFTWYMDRVFGLGKMAVRVLAPVSRHLFKVELPSRRAMNQIEELFDRLQAVQSLLKDPRSSSVRLVTIPERIVVAETRRSYTYLNLFGYLVDGLFINNVYPPDQMNGFFAEWVRLQHEHLAELETTLGHLPTTIIPRHRTDLLGLEAVARLAREHLDEHSFEIGDRSPNEFYEKHGDDYRLTIGLPGVRSDELDLLATSEELTITLGAVRRKIMLPTALHHHKVGNARCRDDRLVITFTPQGA